MAEAADYDGAWKEALELYLKPFLRLCFPVVWTGIDWSVRVEFLDQELQEVVRDAELGKQRADKLAKVQRLDGLEEWILIHVEIQAQRDASLAQRMYQYYHRIADRYGQRVVSLAVLADPQPEWYLDHYEEGLWGCRLRFEYPTCKLLDLGRDPRQLEQSDNPAAVIIGAHLAAQQTVRDMDKRHQLKWSITRRLYEQGYAKQEILDLFRLVDWLMVLPPGLEIAFRRELATLEKEKVMPYVTSIERLGRQEGRQEGRREGRREGRQAAIVELLEARFGAPPSSVIEGVKAVQDEALLSQLLRQAAVLPSMERFAAELPRKGATGPEDGQEKAKS